MMTIGQALDATIAELKKQAPDMEWQVKIRGDRPNALLVHLTQQGTNVTRSRFIGFELIAGPDDVAGEVERGVSSFRSYLVD